MYGFDRGDVNCCVTGVVSESWCRRCDQCEIQVGGCSKLAGRHVWASNANGVNSDESGCSWSGVVWYEAGKSNVREYGANRIWRHVVGVRINESGCGWENEGGIDGNG